MGGQGARWVILAHDLFSKNKVVLEVLMKIGLTKKIKIVIVSADIYITFHRYILIWLFNKIVSQFSTCVDEDVTCVIFIGWFFGDPHIRTVDGLDYTFNGLGEYWLLKSNVVNGFSVQGRTGKAWDKEGNDVGATVFTAFAAVDNGTTQLHVELTPWDRKG